MSHSDVNPNAPPPDSNPDIYAYFAVAPQMMTTTSAIVHILTRPPTSPSHQTVTETTQVRTQSVALTHLRNKTMRQGGLCAYTAGCLQSFFMPGPFQVGDFPEEYIALHQIDLDLPLHHSLYMEATQRNYRLRHVQCRCFYQTCDTQGNDLRIMLLL